MASSANRLIEQSGKRKPRVHIKYETFTGGATKLVELPFVVGVMADLTGSNRPADSLKDRRFTEFSAGEFDSRMKAMKPQAKMMVPNRLTGEEGELSVQLTFESMNDFTPEAIARQVEPLRKLIERRDKLQNLAAHLDGKDTEELEKILADPTVVAAMAASAKAQGAGKTEKN